ncbi:MAG TPA: YqaJ viral recombinase family protein, partial [Gemmata sp.]
MNRLNLNQGSPEWLAWRREGLGGSDIAAILGLSPYEDATRQSVFDAKVHGTERDPNFAMRRGTLMEPEARLAYMTRTRCTAPPVCVEMAGCPWARVSLDGLADNGAVIPSQREEWVLELKCPGWATHDLALAGIVAEHFEVQCQWQMLVTGIQRCDFASFNPGKRFTPGNAPDFDTWKQRPPAQRPPMPAEWLAVLPVPPDPDRQAWILAEAGK